MSEDSYEVGVPSAGKCRRATTKQQLVIELEGSAMSLQLRLSSGCFRDPRLVGLTSNTRLRPECEFELTLNWFEFTALKINGVPGRMVDTMAKYLQLSPALGHGQF